MIEYKYDHDDLDGDEGLMKCESCEASAPLHAFEGCHTEETMRRHGLGKGMTRHLCEICANTVVGNATAYPDQHRDFEALKLQAYSANRVIDAVTGRRAAAIAKLPQPSRVLTTLSDDKERLTMAIDNILSALHHCRHDMDEKCATFLKISIDDLASARTKHGATPF